MRRVTLRVPEKQVEDVDQLVESGEFPNRSEAIRAAVREMLQERDLEDSRPAYRRARTDGGER